MNLNNPQASEPHFSLPSTPGTNIAKSPTNVNLKASASFKKFPAGAKLDRTQSLRVNARPLGPFNGQTREQAFSATTDVSFLYKLASITIILYAPKLLFSIFFKSIDDSKLPKKNANVISKAMEYMFGW